MVGLLRLQRQEPANLAQHQSAGGRRPPVPGGLALQPDSPRRAARQHHPGGEHRLLQLPRAVGVGHEAAVSRPAVRHVVHLVEVARYEFAQFVRLRRPGRLRHSQPVRPVGFRRPASIRAQRHLRAAVRRARADPGLAARGDRPGAERQPRQHRHEQQHASTACRTPCVPT